MPFAIANLGPDVSVDEMASLAKGSLIVGDGVGAPDELVAGTNNLPLIADSAQTKGLKYAILPLAGGGTNGATAEAAMQNLGGPVRYSLSAVDGKTTGATKIVTTASSGGRFHPRLLRVVATAANTAVVACAFSIGTNSTAYDDILAISTATAVLAANKVLSFNLDLTAIASVANSTDIFVKITTGATATTLTLRFDLFGDYL